jgi:hypothetical protein
MHDASVLSPHMGAAAVAHVLVLQQRPRDVVEPIPEDPRHVLEELPVAPVSPSEADTFVGKQAMSEVVLEVEEPESSSALV